MVSPPDRRGAGGPALHRRHRGGAAAGDAQPPRAAGRTSTTPPGQPAADSVVGLALPLSGAYGLAAILGSWIATGCRLVVADERADLAALAAAESITHLPVTPPQIFRLLQRSTHADTDLRSALASVTSVVSAGARLPWPLTREFTERTGLRLEQAYGLTETGRGVSSTLGAELLGPGHVGRALSGVEIRIGDGTEDEPGEIAVRGDDAVLRLLAGRHRWAR